MEENVKLPLIWSTDGVTRQEMVNNEEERSLTWRNMDRMGSQAPANNKYGDTGECKNKG